MARVQETLAVLVLFLGCLRSAVADVDCQSETAIYRLQQECFLDEGINITLPTLSVTNSAANTKKSYIDAVLGNRADLLCTNQEKMKKAMKCAMTRAVNCMPDAYRGFLPRPASMEQVVTVMCNGMTSANFQCVTNKASELFDCGYRRGQEVFGSGREQLTVENILCKAFEITIECQNSVLRSCGCSTVKTQETVTVDLMYPPACPRPTLYRGRTMCDALNPQSFMDNGGQRHLGSSVSFFVSSLLVLLNLSAVYFRQ